ncbi:autotransporter domain-containing protein [Azospirillum sp. RWY-5-1]|uniref:Autotransporter domain-containing protein n=1 Tax=Azospirillum oleiclasticum TaxID=2735135 RepID=A0ABX2T3E1_9PROT|nr:esterase-like activity of phytase family protein [Azospirillum oleiclasticum]NYZ11421.1 autotransporter domain-containing protein [Azospirillum oleiclasticum]NYZ18582.1 autotransporter domain-containing protein [Azospirillum oleiclasticum]
MPDTTPPRLRRALLSACSPAVLLAAVSLTVAAGGASAQVNSLTVSGGTLVNQGLVGVGRISASQRDKFGETFGSMSGLAFDAKAWRRNGDSYTGVLFSLPDRGYNVVGTTDYRTRFNTLALSFTPYTGSTATTQQNQVAASLTDTTLFTESNGTSLTGLDPQPRTGLRAATSTLPVLPQAYNGKISLDPEGIVRLSDGSFFVSDEYGPYIYRFSSTGTLMSAIQPPRALLPFRNGSLDFSSNNPATGQPTPSPADPTTGRQNNQGLEGLAITPDQKQLVALLQSATRQDGGTGGSSATRYNTRMLVYNIENPSSPVLAGHYVVQLPRFTTGSGATNVAAQSEMLALNGSQFLVLSRDSNNGQGLSGTTSRYRSIDFVDISNATNLVGTAYEGTTPVAPGGALVASVTPVSYTQFVDMNNNAQLGRFGLRNGAPNDRNNLSEKWEAMGLLPALDPGAPDDFFLFVGNDNDFLTTNGYQVGASYNAGADVDTMLLVYRLTLPTYVDPVAVESLYQTALPLARGIHSAAIDVATAGARILDDHLASLQLAKLRGGGLSAGEGTGMPLSLYVTGDLNFSNPDSAKGTASGDSNARAVVVGADLRLSETVTAGLAIGFGSADASVSGAGSADLRSISVSPYIAASMGRLYGGLSFTYAWNDYDKITRDTGAYGLVAHGDTRGSTLSAGVNAGYELGGGDWSYGPVAGVRYTRIEVDGYTERDAIHMNATLPSETIDGWSANIGGQLAKRFRTDSMDIIPQLRLGYEWSRFDGADTLSASLANRSSMSIARVSRNMGDLDRDGARVGVGVTLAQGALSWTVGYDGKYGADIVSHNVLTTLQYAF